MSIMLFTVFPRDRIRMKGHFLNAYYTEFVRFSILDALKLESNGI